MRKVAFGLAVLLAFAALSVGAAWLCAAFATLDPESTQVLSRIQEMPSAAVVSGFGRTRTDWIGPEALAPPVTITFEQARQVLDDPEGSAHSVEDAGWPFRCMRSTTHGSVLIPSTNHLGVNGVATWGFPQSNRTFTRALPLGDERLSGALSNYRTWRALPLQPLWRGLAANVGACLAVLIGCVLWMKLVRAAIRRRRRHRGVCASCAHPLAGLLRCPECGTPAQNISPPLATPSN